MCTGAHADFIDNPPSWTGRRYPNNQHFQKANPADKDPPLREGHFSNLRLHELWLRKTNNGRMHLTAEELRHLKRDLCFSVVRQPLIEAHPGKQTLGVMHGPHGVTTNFKGHVIQGLRAIDSENGEFMEYMKAVQEDILVYATQSKEFKKAQRESSKLAKDMQRVKAAIRNPNEYQTVEALQTKLATLTEARIKHAEDSGLSNLVRLMKGAGILKQELTKFMSSSSKKPRGEAEFVFLKAVEIFGGFYNAEHGGFELTHSDGIDMLEEWDKICALVSNTYPNSPTNTSISEFMED